MEWRNLECSSRCRVTRMCHALHYYKARKHWWYVHANSLHIPCNWRKPARLTQIYWRCTRLISFLDWHAGFSVIGFVPNQGGVRLHPGHFPQCYIHPKACSCKYSFMTGSFALPLCTLFGWFIMWGSGSKIYGLRIEKSLSCPYNPIEALCNKQGLPDTLLPLCKGTVNEN